MTDIKIIPSGVKMFTNYNVPVIPSKYIRLVGFNRIDPASYKDKELTEDFHTQLGVHFELSNTTNCPLFIHDRFGVKSVIWPTTGQRERNIRLRNEIQKSVGPVTPTSGFLKILLTFSYDEYDLEDAVKEWAQFANISKFYEKMFMTLDNELKLRRNLSKYPDRIFTVSIEVLIPAKDIATDKPIFIRELGLTIAYHATRAHADNIASYPYLYRQVLLNDDKVGFDPEDPAFHRFKAYVKHEGFAKKMYVKMFDTVMEIPVIYDSTGERHGIEVFCKRRVNETGEVIDTAPVLYTFEEAERLFGIKDNVMAAFNFAKDEVERLRKERDLREEEYKAEALKYNFEKLKREKEEKEAEFSRTIELHQRRIEEIEMKTKRDDERFVLEMGELEKRHKRELEMLKAKAEADVKQAEAKARAEAAAAEQRRKQNVFDFFKNFLSSTVTVFSSILQIMKSVPKPT